MNSRFLPVACLALICLVALAYATPLLDPEVFQDCLMLQINSRITVKRCKIDALDGGYYVVKVAKNSSHEGSMSTIANEVKKFSILKETLQENGINPQDVGVVYPVEFTAPEGIVTFPYYPNGDLRQYYSINDLKIDHDIAQIATDVLRTLSVLHQNRINFVHNDLKMENIVVTSVGDDGGIQEVKLIDFEQAGIHEDIYDGNYGSVGYLSPEIISGATNVTRYSEIGLVSKASDVWTLGITLYRLIFNENIFTLTGKDFSSKLHRAIWKYRRQYFHVWRKIRFSSKLSGNAKHFLLKLLKWDFKKRLTASEALNHPFIQEFINSQESAAQTTA
jgi:serine/threonine protein kinase